MLVFDVGEKTETEVLIRRGVLGMNSVSESVSLKWAGEHRSIEE